jgi:hypothetical protein
VKVPSFDDISLDAPSVSIPATPSASQPSPSTPSAASTTNNNIEKNLTSHVKQVAGNLERFAAPLPDWDL